MALDSLLTCAPESGNREQAREPGRRLLSHANPIPILRFAMLSSVWSPRRILRVTCAWPGLLVVSAAMCLTTGCDARSDEAPSSSVLRLTRVIGQLDGPLSFGAVGPTAANDSLLAIADLEACEIVVYSLARNVVTQRFGGCGGGPGEFGMLTALSWHGDSLLAVDDRRRITVLDGTGKLVRTIPLDLGPAVALVSGVMAANDSTILVSLGLMPSTYVRSTNATEAHSFVAVLNSQSGAVRNRLLQDLEPISLKNKRNAGRLLPTCFFVRSGRSGFATLSRWRFQGSVVALDTSAAEPVIFESRVPGFEPDKTGEQEWTPAGIATAVCSDSLALFHWSSAAPKRRRGYMEVRQLDGRPRLMQRITWADSGLLAGPSSASGNRFYFITNKIHEFPVVLEYELVDQQALELRQVGRPTKFVATPVN